MTLAWTRKHALLNNCNTNRNVPFDFVRLLLHLRAMRSECDRTRLIAELACFLRECDLPQEARAAGLTLIGFLARRMPGEGPSTVGVAEVTERARASQEEPGSPCSGVKKSAAA